LKLNILKNHTDKQNTVIYALMCDTRIILDFYNKTNEMH